ncbi:HpcH/HpaI aldolase/citrate lyase family protein [Bacillus sp. 179-C3.3 HS]|uniref:HpcH/HpaI aldolase/citrate lyase family protein n=1 Tax=Bacillus sp. 179-C3.3 HS TaxID=3232162 RepID=UPI0039A2CD36
MRYFHFLSEARQRDIFLKRPVAIHSMTPKHVLAHALGATLYMPATRQDVADMLFSQKYEALCSVVFCLEDAIGDQEVEMAEQNLVTQLTSLQEKLVRSSEMAEHLPLLFIRVRSPKQLLKMTELLGSSLHILTGFVFPKCSVHNAKDYLDSLKWAEQQTKTRLYGMPILETPDLIEKETRYSVLAELKQIMLNDEQHILNIRIGATDLCGLYGIRRDRETTIYEIRLLADLITDVMNYFGRSFVVSGAVWEYFEPVQKEQKPMIHALPKGGATFSSEFDGLQGLLEETRLDVANGIHGKTVIHPTHLKPVQSMYVVTKEEYLDALSIMEHADGTVGVMKSAFSNKMNETKPHYRWAERILMKSDIYGVFHENRSYIDILTETETAYAEHLGTYGG